VGRRGRALTVAAIVAGAGIAAALVVVLTGAGHQALPVIGGEGSGTVTLAPILVDRHDPAPTGSPSAPEPTIAPSEVVDGAEGGTSELIAGAPGGVGVRVGSVGGLFPGHRVKLGVTYMNPYSFPIAIDMVRVIATGTDRCPARHLMPTPQPNPRLHIQPGSSVGTTVEVGMRRSAPDACQGVRFAVSVDVMAVQL
jgi:hypothetical protein